MTRDQAIKIINAAAIPPDKKEELIENLKNPTVTKTEAQIIIKILDKNLAELQTPSPIAIDKEALKQMYLETRKQMDAIYKEYEKTMKDLDKQAQDMFTQAGEYIDKLRAEDLAKKIKET